MSKRVAMGIVLSLSLAAGLASAAAPGGDARDVLKGRWAFNWAQDPSKTKCAKVEGKLLAVLKSKPYACDLAEKTNSASGHPVVSCNRTHPVIEYLIFKTRAMCEDERKTQESNGD